MPEHTDQISNFSPRAANGAQGTLPFLEAEFAEILVRTPTIRGFDQDMSALLSRTWGRATNEQARDVTLESFLAELTTEHAGALEGAGVDNVAGLNDALVLYVHKQRSIAPRTNGRPEAAHDLMALLRGASMHAHYAGRSDVNVADVLWSLEAAITTGHAVGPGLQALARVWPRLSMPDPLQAVAKEIVAIRDTDLEGLRTAVAAARSALNERATAEEVRQLRTDLIEEFRRIRADLTALDDRWSDPHGRGKAKKADKNSRPLATAFTDSH